MELIKWIALLAMAVDHIGLIFSDYVDYYACRAIGRLTWPLLAFVMAVRLTEKPDRTRNYLAWLLPWAVISQPVYWFTFYVQQPFHEAMLNVFFTLAFGVLLFWFMEIGRRTKSKLTRILLGTATVMILAIAQFPVGVDYGAMAVLMIPALALAIRTYGVARAALLTGLLGAMTVTVAMNTTGRPLMTAIVILGPMAAGLVAWLCLRTSVHLPRLPRWFFYFYYPAHMIALIAIAFLLT